MSRHTIRFLSADEVRKALPMSEAVEVMKQAFAELSAGRATLPARTHIGIEDPPGDVLFMPSYMPGLARVGLKTVTLFPGNREKGLPFINALVCVFDAETGRAVAVMDGASLTAIRTGAASGAATDLMARPDAKTVAVFGAGVQARTQLAAICAVRQIAEARVFDISAEAREAFAGEMSRELGLAVRGVGSSAEALAGADVVATATTSTTPVFADADLAPGAHVNAVGSYKPHVSEVPPETVKRAYVVVDQVEAALEEAGDLIGPMEQGLITRDHIRAELGEVVSGAKPGRPSPEAVTFFKSVGVAVQDLAAACRALANAERLSLGSEVEM
ncbi:MAG: ornithine cyclodeaminase family protein [Planctomycetota bacterium]|jgi:ornithine cyclodeaminase/alanine dehydrogenase-like protein (mu-crystallin family)